MPKPTTDALLKLAMERIETNEGVCHSCGHTQDGVEPDAAGYECEACGALDVWGAEITLIRLAL